MPNHPPQTLWLAMKKTVPWGAPQSSMSDKNTPNMMIFIVSLDVVIVFYVSPDIDLLVAPQIQPRLGAWGMQRVNTEGKCDL